MEPLSESKKSIILKNNQEKIDLDTLFDMNKTQRDIYNMIFEKLPINIAAIARCGLPSFRTKHKNTLFKIKDGANNINQYRYVFVSSKTLVSAPSKDAISFEKKTPSNIYITEKIKEIKIVFEYRRLISSCLPWLLQTENLVAAPMPNIKPVP